jgi:Cytochrome P460
MTSSKKAATVLGVAYAIALSLSVHAQPSTNDGPRYMNGTHLVRPADYREWIFLSSGLGMTYEPPSGSSTPPSFGNVFVNPSSYRRFLQTGKWPDRTVFVLEVRRSESEGSINKSGRFQTGVVAVEAEVKDSRFPDGWAYFNFGTASDAPPLAGDQVARCIDCHTKHTAVERTFVQFYPTLLEVARQKGTLKPGF